MNAIFLASTLLFIIQAEGAKKCYVCTGKCEKPLEIKICDLPDSTDYFCKASALAEGFVRECQPNTLDTKELCEEENKQGDSACYICETDLCNDHNPGIEKKNNTNKPESGVKMCYACKGDCNNPHEEICNITNTSDYLCEAVASIKNGVTRTTRKCIPNTEEKKTFCKSINEKNDSGCYTCETDLCNDHNPEIEQKNNINKPKSDVKKCYACKGDCNNPHEEICNITNTSDYLCEAVASIKSGVTRTIRKCIPNTEENKKNCKSLNNNKDVGCYTCDTDLCNKRDPINEVGVGAKKCYFCDGDCKELQEEICEFNSYVCQAWSMKINGVTEHVRQCVPNTKDVEQACQAVGLKESGSCYNCHKDMCNNQSEVPDLEFLHLAPEEGGVQKCYACKDKCENPQEQTCDVNNYLCQESVITKNGIAVSSRNCVPNTEYVKGACAKLNALEGFSCYTCNHSLCNNKFPRNEEENVAGTYSAPAMVLATLVSLFLIKL